MLILDVLLVCFALYSSFWLRFEGQIPQQYGDYMVRSLIPVGLLSLGRFGAFPYMFNIHFPRSVNSLFFCTNSRFCWFFAFVLSYHCRYS